MTEQINEEKAENKEQTPNGVGTGNISQTNSLIERADFVAKRMEEANKKAEELLSRQEAILARNMLSGRAEAGYPQKTAEELQKEQIDKKVKDMLSKFI